MGNWNRRYVPKRKFRHYEYEDPPLSSPPRPYNHSYASGFEGNKVPSWEIDYCNSARVPWRKILASKKYIYSYPTVLNWDASGGEEALHNAKQRYWATINGLPCDNPLADPDKYVDEIDWNPNLDPELMADLDRQVFPDELQNVEKSETVIERVENQSINDNPWEKDNAQDNGSSKDAARGWSRWEDSINLKNGNPWEQSCSPPVDSSYKDNAWRSGGWGQEIDNGNSRSFTRRDGWGRGGKNSWGCGRGNNNEEWARNLGNSRNSCGNDVSTGAKESGWADNRNKFWNQRESEHQDCDSQNYTRGGQSFRDGCRKREGFQQHESKYKSSRYHGDSYGNNRQW